MKNRLGNVQKHPRRAEGCWGKGDPSRYLHFLKEVCKFGGSASIPTPMGAGGGNAAAQVQVKPQGLGPRWPWGRGEWAVVSVPAPWAAGCGDRGMPAPAAAW